MIRSKNCKREKNQYGKSVNSLLKISILSAAMLSMPSVLAFETSNELYEIALIEFQNNNVSTSIIHLKNALQQDENHMSSRLLLAQAYLLIGDGIAAEVELNKAQENNVDADRLVTLFAHAYILQSKYADVIRVTARGNRSSNIESQLLIYRGQALIGQKLYRPADSAFQDALVLSPNNQQALLGRSQLSFQANKIEQALEFVNLALGQPTPFINGWILKANILQKTGRITEAMLAIEQALMIDNTHMAARLTKAMLHIILKEFKLAEPHVDFIIAEIPNEPRAGYLKALINASINKGDGKSDELKLAEVITTLSAVPVEIMQATPDYYYLAGLTNFQYGNLEDARRYLTQYLKYSAFHLDSVRMIAIIDLKLGDLRSAKNLLIKANVARPNDPNILSLLGMVYLQLKETKKAESYFIQVLSMYPDSAVGISNLAQSKMQSGQYGTAIEALLSIKDNEINGTQIKLLLVDSYERSGNIPAAISIVKELIAANEQDSYFHQRLGVLYGLGGQIEDSKSAFTSAIKLDDGNILAIIHLARIKNIENKLDEALEYLQEKLVQHPNNILLMSEISDTYFFKGELKQRLTWLNKAHALDPANYYILTKLVQALLDEKNLDQAIDTVDAYIGQNKKELKALALIASLYQKANKHRQAVLALREHLAKSYDKANAYILLAKAQIAANNELTAIQSYKKATVIDQDSLAAHIGLVNLTIKNKNKDYSLVLIDAIYRITQSKSIKEVLLGDLYQSLNEHKKAVGHYQAALKISNQKQAILGLYQSKKSLNNVNSIIPQLRKWLIRYPNDLLVKITLADALYETKQYDKATSYYIELIEKHGELPILLNNIANVYFASGEHEKSLSYARKAFEYVQDNVAIIDTLGWIESRLGNYDTALGLFRKALTQDYDNAEIKYHIAVTLHALNRQVEAKQYLMESLNSTQDFKEKPQAQTFLSNW